MSGQRTGLPKEQVDPTRRIMRGSLMAESRVPKFLYKWVQNRGVAATIEPSNLPGGENATMALRRLRGNADHDESQKKTWMVTLIPAKRGLLILFSLHFPCYVGVRGNSLREDHQMNFHTRRLVAKMCPGHRSYSGFHKTRSPCLHISRCLIFSYNPSVSSPRVPLIFLSPRFRYS